ncbi:MAG TPA: hypothetical protein VMF30_14825 [Pirellulales bacterium]|nr:hypothetical protein [Pirellulales bacterium]
MIHARAQGTIGQRALTGILVLGLLLAGHVATTLAKAKASPRVTGQVTDAVTGRPVETFDAIPVSEFDQECIVQRGQAKHFTAGQYQLDLQNAKNGHRVRIEAEGYRAAMSDVFRVGQQDPVVNFALEPATATVGRVFNGARKPVSGAQVFLATPSQIAWLPGGDIRQNPSNVHAKTDRFGAFSFLAQFEPYTVIAMHDSGYAEVARKADEMAGELVLAPWARIEARLQYGDPVADRTSVCFAPLRPQGSEAQRIQDAWCAKSDASGRYFLDRVPPSRGGLDVQRRKSSEFVSAEYLPVDVPPGRQISHEFGAGGQIRGSIALAGDKTDDVRFENARVWLVKKGALITPPPGVDAEKFAPSDGWNDAWETPAGRAYFGTLHLFYAKPTKGGVFRFEGVPAGNYTLAIRVFHHRERERSLSAKTHLVQITVGETDAAKRNTIDLAAIQVDTALRPDAEAAGEPPDEELPAGAVLPPEVE